MTSRSQVKISESEDQLIAMAQAAVSQSNWVVGECAFKWTKKYARGRTDADFAAQVGLSADQVYQRRRVWETFGDVREQYASLRWSHFYVCLKWDDAAECLQWADENNATVAEMKAWRRSIFGEDEAAEMPLDAWAGDPTVLYIPTEPTLVRDVSQAESSGARTAAAGAGSAAGSRERAETVGALARNADESGREYAPFRKGAGSPAPAGEPVDTAVAQKPLVPADKMLKRMCASLERMSEALTPELVAEIRKLPDPLRQRFVQVVSRLSNTAASLM